jgi:hypothetical protein
MPSGQFRYTATGGRVSVMYDAIQLAAFGLDDPLGFALPLLEQEGHVCDCALITQCPEPIGIDWTILPPVLASGDHPLQSVDVP